MLAKCSFFKYGISYTIRCYFYAHNSANIHKSITEIHMWTVTLTDLNIQFLPSHLINDTPDTPHVHSMIIVPISEQALW